MPHLFVDISSHGLGHLAQTAPILNELTRLLPGLRLTVRSGVPPEKLHARLHGQFTHLPERSDFGFVMHDATRIDLAASASAYRAQHADWEQRVAAEAAFLLRLRPNLVLTDVAYLPLAGAARAGIPSLSMCSLNWAEMFSYFFSPEPWATEIHQQMLSAYNGADEFLRFTPGMPMCDLPRVHSIGAVAALGVDRRTELREKLQCSAEEKLVLAAFGGVEKKVSYETWPMTPGVHWIIPQRGSKPREDMMTVFEDLNLPFNDLLASVDAVLTKPGYGTFVEAACSATSVLYLRSEDWPEQGGLIEWLKVNVRCAEISHTQLINGQLVESLRDLWRQPVLPKPHPAGVQEAAEIILSRLTAGS
ncbi:MAG: hypothetical protein WCK63_01345 [Betaproteobacteria bacterium]